MKKSMDEHGKASYYHSHTVLSDQDKILLNNQNHISTGGLPFLLAVSEDKKEEKLLSIDKYDILNDGKWYKLIINLENYSLNKINEDNIKCNF